MPTNFAGFLAHCFARVGDVVNYMISSPAGVAITTCVFAIIWGALALLWTPAPTEPTRAASEQSGAVTSAASTAPILDGDENRAGSGTSLELSTVPMVGQTEPRSNSELPGSTPLPESRQTLNAPAAVPEANHLSLPSSLLSEAPLGPLPEPTAPSGNTPQLLPENAPIHVLVSYTPGSAAARQEAAEIVNLLRGGGLEASDPAPAARVVGKPGIIYFFAEDRDGTSRVEQDLGEGFGPARLSPPAPGEPLRRPGTIEVLVPAR